MSEAKWELKNWCKWKRTVRLLEETRDQLKDTTQGICINTEEMPGGAHKPITDKFNKIIEDCEKYDEIIKQYNFIIDRLEKAITELLSEEQRCICIIYANHPNNSKKREFEAMRKGFVQATYYRILKESFETLDCVLNPFDSKLIVNKQENDI